MRQSKLYHRTIAAFAGTLSVTIATSASATGLGGFDQSASFNQPWGMTNAQQNEAVDPSMRDANGNLTIINGLVGPASVSQQSGAGTAQAGSGSGNGTAAATAIGNSLNVQVQGSWNTVIVNSTQKNTGDQNANASLNGQLKF